MKKYFALALGFGLLFSANAWAANGYNRHSDSMAPDRQGKWELGMGVAAGFNDKADDSVFVGGEISYGVTPYIGLGVEAGWMEADGESAPDDTVGVVPVMADIYLRIPTVHESLVPYGVLGLGGVGVYVERDNLDDVDDTAFGWKLGAGLDYFVDPNWIINLEFAWWSASIELPTTSIGDDYDWWTIGVSLKYVF